MPRLGIMLQSGGVYPWATAGDILGLVMRAPAWVVLLALTIHQLSTMRVSGMLWIRPLRWCSRWVPSTTTASTVARS